MQKWVLARVFFNGNQISVSVSAETESQAESSVSISAEKLHLYVLRRAIHVMSVIIAILKGFVCHFETSFVTHSSVLISHMHTYLIIGQI